VFATQTFFIHHSRRDKMVSEKLHVKVIALLLRSRIDDVSGYGDNIYLQTANNRLKKLIEDIDNQQCPTIFVAKHELVTIGDIINNNIQEIDVEERLNQFLQSVKKIKERLFIS
jgi:hypothetical protein